MMTYCHNYLQIYVFSFFEFTREGGSKITLTFGYYFRIGCPEQFHQKSGYSKVQRFQITFWQ